MLVPMRHLVLRQRRAAGFAQVPDQLAIGRHGAERRLEVLLGQAEDTGRHPVPDPEHYGVNLSYHRGPIPREAAEQLRARRPDLDPADVVPTSPAALAETVDAWLAAGYSKFLLRPLAAPDDWTAELETLAEEILWKQT